MEQIAISNLAFCDYAFGIAVKEMEAWLLGDSKAIHEAYPDARMQFLQKYEQDGICDIWEVLAEMVYPKGLRGLRKKAGGSYTEIGKAKSEWADRIGQCLHLHENASPSYSAEKLTKETIESTDKTVNRYLECKNKGLEGTHHPITGVEFIRKTVVDDTGELVEGVFPKFKAITDVKLPSELYKESNFKQFKEANR